MPTNDEFYIGQYFHVTYPPEAAAWCNTHNAYIEDQGICPNHGTRRFQIKANEDPQPEPVPSIEVARADAKIRNKEAFQDKLAANTVNASSLGFTISGSARNVEHIKNLVIILEANPESTRKVKDTNGVVHEVTLAQVRQLNAIFAESNDYIWERKYDFEKAIEEATTAEELIAMKFEYKTPGEN